MQVRIYSNALTAQQAAAKLICETINNKRTPNLGLATGGTMLGVYEELVAKYNAGLVDFKNTRTFNLDEYIGLPNTHPQSYRYYMQQTLFNHINIDQKQTFIPYGAAADPAQEALNYEKTIEDNGGIDLQLLGIGHNGHIGFNEPTSSLGSITRIKTLTPETIKANSRFFGEDEQQPRFAITMGIATILKARSIVLLAIGKNKSHAVMQMIEGPLGAHCPASALQMHPNVKILLDPEAASELVLKDYYQFVHPEGEDATI